MYKWLGKIWKPLRYYSVELCEEVENNSFETNTIKDSQSDISENTSNISIYHQSTISVPYMVPFAESQ